MANFEKNMIQNDVELEFAIFCVENVAIRLGVGAEKVYEALTVKSDILYSYIVPCYEILHTQGKEYIVDDIIETMRERGVIRMIIYHGSYVEISKPDISYSRNNLHFERSEQL